MKKKTYPLFRALIVSIVLVVSGAMVTSCNNDSSDENVTYDIPHVNINTSGGAEIESKEDYVGMTATISYGSKDVQIETSGKIRGRGHSTWDFEKKPYKLKFDGKQSPFGFPANRDWVLLADYNDRSLLRTAYMAELSKAANLDFTIHYQHVHLYLNDEYQGVYLFTDHIEKAKDRVNIEDDGYLMKYDGYYLESPVYLITESERRVYTFKYPDGDDGGIVEGDENFEFIQDYIDSMESALYLLEDEPDNTEYLKYIDPVSFARWYLVAEMMAVVDVNQYLVLPSKASTLKTYPIWDAEWSLGLWPSDAFGWTPESLETESRWVENGYFEYLFLSNKFRDVVVEEWNKMKVQIPTIRYAVQKVADSITKAQYKNFDLWPDSGKLLGNVYFDTWQDEVDYVNDFYQKRAEWLDGFISQTVSTHR